MVQQVFALISEYGLLLVFLSVLAEQIGLPVPSPAVLMVAGALAADGRFPLAATVVVSLVACLIADFLWFSAGRRFGARVLRTLCRISLSPDSCVHQSELRFDQWGSRILVVAKLVPGLSTVAPPLAGALGLDWRVFLALDGVGALLWTAVGLGVGYLFAAQIDELLGELHVAGAIALGIVLGLFFLFVLTRWLRRRQRRHALELPRIMPSQLKQAIDGGRAPVIIDVRSSVSRKSDPRTVNGALLADPAHVERAVRGIPHDHELVTYCNCPNEATSARAAKTLIAHHYRSVRPLEGGLIAWEEAGYAPRRALACRLLAPWHG